MLYGVLSIVLVLLIIGALLKSVALGGVGGILLIALLILLFTGYF